MSAEQSGDISELALRLTAFGRRTFADFGLGGHDTTVAGVGLSVEDFVWKVLEEYVTGHLAYDTSRGDMFSLLATAMRNDIIDALRKAAHIREEIRSPFLREWGGEDDPPGLDELPCKVPHLLERLNEAQYRRDLSAALGGEPELMQMVRIILDRDIHKPREIAAVLGVSVTEVQNRKKKLRRRFIEHNLARGLEP